MENENKNKNETKNQPLNKLCKSNEHQKAA